jgi:hypothetical protein
MTRHAAMQRCEQIRFSRQTALQRIFFVFDCGLQFSSSALWRQEIALSE